MPQNKILIPWDKKEWFQHSHAWIHDQLVRLGLAPSGDIKQIHRRPWSTVLQVPTGAGNLYFKASTPSLSHEAALTHALASWRPELIPPVLAFDADRSWMLLEEGGSTLRSFLGSDRYLSHWRRVLPLYAQLQVELSARSDEMLKLGMLDRRLATLPAQFEVLLEDREALMIDEPEGLSTTQYQFLREFRPHFSAMCTTLADFGLPETIQHDDFHGNNIFAGEGTYRFFDWGESCLAHPFFTLVVTLRGIAYFLEVEENEPVLRQLQDLYLEPWLDYLGWSGLRKTMKLATLIGKVNRSLTWYHVVSQLPEPYRTEEAGAVPGWLTLFLEAVTSHLESSDPT